MNFKLILGLAIFFLTFYHIIKDKYSKPLVAIIGGTSMVLTGILSEHKALGAVSNNLEVIFLLIGLMMIVEVMAESGLFQWLAIIVAQKAHGDPLKILILLSSVTAICSAVLDNVTTVLLIIPIAILIARQLKIDPMPMVMIQIFSANIGGAASMIGDPPNLLIAAAARLGFNQFIVNLAPLVIVNMAVLITTSAIFFKKRLQVTNELRATIMELDASRAIKNKKLLIQSTSVFGLCLIGFLTNTVTHFGLSTIAMFGAAALLVISKQSPHHIIRKVEWETLFFFAGLFVLVDGIEQLGVMEAIAKVIINFTNGSIPLTTQLILVISTMLSPILGASPYTVSFIKVVKEIMPSFVGNTEVFWWSLSLGACLGGNLTIVGASANIVASSIAKSDGIDISFTRFLKYGSIAVLQSVLLSSIYLYLFY